MFAPISSSKLRAYCSGRARAQQALRVADLLLDLVVADAATPLPRACGRCRAIRCVCSPTMRSSCFSRSATLPSSASLRWPSICAFGTRSGPACGSWRRVVGDVFSAPARSRRPGAAHPSRRARRARSGCAATAAALRAVDRRPPRPGPPPTDRPSPRRGASRRRRCAAGARCRPDPGAADRATASRAGAPLLRPVSASARCRSPPLPPADWPAASAALAFDFLFLPARELLQLLGELVDLLILLLRRGLRVGLVLVRHLVHFHLEQVGQIVRDRSRSAAAATAAGLAAGLHLQLEFLFGLLQELQRHVLGRQRAVGALRLQLLLRARSSARPPSAAARRSS